jgi:hypothetical protein
MLVSTASGRPSSGESGHLREAGLPRLACPRPKPKLGLSCALAQEPLHVVYQAAKGGTFAEARVFSPLLDDAPERVIVEPSDLDAMGTEVSEPHQALLRPVEQTAPKCAHSE